MLGPQGPIQERHLAQLQPLPCTGLGASLRERVADRQGAGEAWRRAGTLALQPCTTPVPQGSAARTDMLSGLGRLVSGTWSQPSASNSRCLAPEHHPPPEVLCAQVRGRVGVGAITSWTPGPGF